MHRIAITLLISAVPLAASAQTAAPATTQATTAPTTQAAAIPWDQAAQHVDQTVTVTGPVVGIHALSDGSRVILNVGKDYPDPTRLTVLVTLGDNPPDAQSTYVGKTITVTGKVELYKHAPEIRIKAADVMVQN